MVKDERLDWEGYESEKSEMGSMSVLDYCLLHNINLVVNISLFQEMVGASKICN